jgi:hypothetical protein
MRNIKNVLLILRYIFLEKFLKIQINMMKCVWIISVPPEWVIEPKDTSVAAGQRVALHCQADGFPLPTVIWRKGHGDYSYILIH